MSLSSMPKSVLPEKDPTPAVTTSGHSPAYPPAIYAWYVIAVLFAVTLLSQLDRQLPSLLVRPLRKEFGISDTAFSLLQGYAFAIFYTLAGLPLGRMVDRGNRRNLILAGLLFWSAATVLFAFGQTYAHLILARIGVGIGEAVLAPAAYSMIADYMEPARRGRALAVYYISIAIGSGASLLLGGWLLAAIPPQGMTIGMLGEWPAWRIAFLAAAAPVVPLALLLLSVREPARREVTMDGEISDSQSSFADFAAHLRAHAATFARVLTYPTLLSIIGYGALAWAPALFDRSFGIPVSRSGPVLGMIIAAAGAAGTLAGGFLSDRWIARAVPAARFRVALAGVAIFAVPSVLWPLMPGPTPAFVLLFITVLGLGLSQSAAPASIQAVVPNRMRGRAIALYLLLAGLLGLGLGPTAVALVTDYVFGNDASLRYSLALTAGPSALFGLWLIGSGLRPYAQSVASMQPG
ncbi:MFS transporter [Cupriavidus sp. SHE]|jgi:MFS family permease|uniref:MFS transporter n=1 Tax=Cupriavidus metallidurans TaxID=119219 RepID=A0A482IV81_9BURK|nr:MULTISPECIES: MFS transporter [Cupriavidus]KWR87009.1 MFS transporter [Cupriavidus sp. SHE]QBP11846.1 MFS transporter [Cupriavidus metallidurans]